MSQTPQSTQPPQSTRPPSTDRSRTIQPPGTDRQSPTPQPPGSVAPPAPVGRTFPTRSYLAEETRLAVIELLNGALADTTTLLTHAKSAHWNVKGPEFYSLHLLFDELAETLEAHADTLAERATALGGQARGTVRTAASDTRVPELPAEAVSGQEHVRLLADRLAVHDAALYEAIETANGYGDADTADLLNEVSRDVSKYLWFLEAHLQGPEWEFESPPARTQPGTGQRSQGPAGQRTRGPAGGP